MHFTSGRTAASPRRRAFTLAELLVGIAWEMFDRERPDLVLHEPDSSHPNAAGTYLAACVFYASIYGKSPEGLPASVSFGGKRISIPPADAQFLQRIAAQAVGAR